MLNFQICNSLKKSLIFRTNGEGKRADSNSLKRCRTHEMKPSYKTEPDCESKRNISFRIWLFAIISYF